MGAAPASMDIILMQHLTPDQKDLARRLQRKAAICWWQHRHPGWTIWHIDSEAYQRGNTSEVPPPPFPTHPHTRAHTCPQSVLVLIPQRLTSILSICSSRPAAIWHIDSETYQRGNMSEVPPPPFLIAWKSRSPLGKHIPEKQSCSGTI